jgi:hypothetical protein
VHKKHCRMSDRSDTVPLGSPEVDFECIYCCVGTSDR